MRRRFASLALVCLLGLPTASYAGTAPYLGEIAMYGFNFPPRDWALCNGQLLAISQNPSLFSLLGTIYGGDGRTTFALPDLRGRVPMHFGNGPGLTNRQIGSRSGSEQTTQAVAHTHTALGTAMGTDERGDSETPGGNVWARKARERDYSTAPPEVQMSPMHDEAVEVQVLSAGSPSVNNMQPYLVINFSIALDGTFPPRN